MEETKDTMSPELQALVNKIENDMENDRAQGMDEVTVQARELKRRGYSVSAISKKLNRGFTHIMKMVQGVERDEDIKELRRRNRKR